MEGTSCLPAACAISASLLLLEEEISACLLHSAPPLASLLRTCLCLYRTWEETRAASSCTGAGRAPRLRTPSWEEGTCLMGLLLRMGDAACSLPQPLAGRRIVAELAPPLILYLPRLTCAHNTAPPLAHSSFHLLSFSFLTLFASYTFSAHLAREVRRLHSASAAPLRNTALYLLLLAPPAAPHLLHSLYLYLLPRLRCASRASHFLSPHITPHS